jgi:hypothetical protein
MPVGQGKLTLAAKLTQKQTKNRPKQTENENTKYQAACFADTFG